MFIYESFHLGAVLGDVELVDHLEGEFGFVFLLLAFLRLGRVLRGGVGLCLEAVQELPERHAEQFHGLALVLDVGFWQVSLPRFLGVHTDFLLVLEGVCVLMLLTDLLEVVRGLRPVPPVAVVGFQTQLVLHVPDRVVSLALAALVCVGEDEVLVEEVIGHFPLGRDAEWILEEGLDLGQWRLDAEDLLHRLALGGSEELEAFLVVLVEVEEDPEVVVARVLGVGGEPAPVLGPALVVDCPALVRLALGVEELVETVALPLDFALVVGVPHFPVVLEGPDLLLGSLPVHTPELDSGVHVGLVHHDFDDEAGVVGDFAAGLVRDRHRRVVLVDDLHQLRLDHLGEGLAVVDTHLQLLAAVFGLVQHTVEPALLLEFGGLHVVDCVVGSRLDALDVGVLPQRVPVYLEPARHVLWLRRVQDQVLLLGDGLLVPGLELKLGASLGRFVGVTLAVAVVVGGQQLGDAPGTVLRVREVKLELDALGGVADALLERVFRRGVLGGQFDQLHTLVVHLGHVLHFGTLGEALLLHAAGAVHLVEACVVGGEDLGAGVALLRRVATGPTRQALMRVGDVEDGVLLVDTLVFAFLGVFLELGQRVEVRGLWRFEPAFLGGLHGRGEAPVGLLLNLDE